MNHFELYEIPVSFNVSSALLEERYAALRRERPDDHQVENAYRLLGDPDALIKYVLDLKGMLHKDEVYEPDPQFTLEVTDINEELVELELDEKREQLMNVEQKTDRLLLKIMEDVAPVLDNYSEDTATEEALLQVKEYWYQKKYVQGILDRIRGVRNIASP